ncbi:MAG: hypothetical protein ACHQ2Z_15310, partial [Elusimicrobiota bacterium]
MEKMEGWIFDAYPEDAGMRVWIVERGGRRRSVLDAWRPSFHVSGTTSQLKTAARVLASLSYPTSTRWVEKKELFSGAALLVWEISVPVRERDALVKRLAALELPLYDADMHLVQAYHYDRGHFPLALCGFELSGERLVSHELRDDPWAVDYEIPPLTTMRLALAGSEIAGTQDPNHTGGGRLVLGRDGRTYELEGRFEEQLETLSRRLQDWDPDVITTEWGDSVLMPQLDRLAKERGVSLDFSRDAGRGMSGRGERSFFTYG